RKMEAIGTLAGGIAHDFNNILGTIIGYAEMMDMFDVEESSPLKPQLAEILNAAERARNLVDRILTFSRQAHMEKVPTSLAPLVKEGMAFLRAGLPSTIRFDVDVERGAGKVLADPKHLHQVLVNLCTNAAQAMRESGGVLTVRLARDEIAETAPSVFPEARPGPAVRLTVKDTGCGMDPAHIEHIFEPYFTTRPPGEGAGLGLAVVHGVVSAAGGMVRVESSPGRGSAFHVYFPLLKEKAARRAEETTVAMLPTGTGRILFVDDEEPLCNWGRMILTRLGYSVDCETAAEAALKKFRQGDYDLVVTDETMPGMRGSALAREIKKMDQRVPVILCSGRGPMMQAKDFLEKGVDNLLSKPLGARALADAVRRALDKSGQGVN
ncbi:MAG: response regulator, partial [Deltaproteobacteria bacterium]|nr:response regulator [Deltaproteobacteria bacterium]